MTIETAALSDTFLDQIRLSAINGGGSNGALPRGSATYKPLSEWHWGWPPREIGILGGVPVEVCAHLAAQGAMRVADA